VFLGTFQRMWFIMTAATWLIFNWIAYKSRWALSSTGRYIIQRLAVLITDQ